MLIAAGDGRGLPMANDELQRRTRVGYDVVRDQVRASAELAEGG